MRAPIAPSTGNHFSLQRLVGMIRKEVFQITRDPSSIAIAFILPVILLLLFGYGVSLDAKHIAIGVVIEKSDAQTSSFRSQFELSDYFDPLHYNNFQEAHKDLVSRKISAIVWLRNNFTDRLLVGGNAPISLIVNGVDANKARITEGYIQAIWFNWLQNKYLAENKPLAVTVNIEHRVWFNSTLNSRDYLVPGLIAVIMTLIGAMLTAMVVAREWERGTLEAIMVTPIHISEFLLGKLIPYFVLGMGGMLLSVAMAYWQFDVPLRGSFAVLLFASILFMLTCLGMGLLISIIAKNQFVAGQIAIIVTFLPAFILSGFIFDINSMPTVIQWITHLVPARYFVAIVQSTFLAGNVWSVIWVNCAYLLLMSVIFFLLVWKKSRKRL